MSAPKILFLAGNDVASDARLLRHLRAAGELGYQAVALGVRFGGGQDLVEQAAPGGRVLVKRVPNRFAGRGAGARLARAGRALAPYALATPAPAGRALAAQLGREARSGLGPPAARAARLAQSLALRAGLKARAAWSRLGPARTGPAGTYAHPAAAKPGRRRQVEFYLRLPAAARWRVVAPQWIEAEIALAPLIDQLAPDIIHAHDVFLLGSGAWAQARAARAGRPVALVYDAREFIPGLAVQPPRTVAALANLEREFIGCYDRVVTVSQAMADAIGRRHRLPRRPDLVPNAPLAAAPPAGGPQVRAAAGAPADAPL
ncbi:MAG: glycosyltransferase, partial [Bifidobacteriaceae bacterium]|nr:glycosyltransferase [Bifidobacteriaceae bacterium]